MVKPFKQAIRGNDKGKRNGETKRANEVYTQVPLYEMIVHWNISSYNIVIIKFRVI